MKKLFFASLFFWSVILCGMEDFGAEEGEKGFLQVEFADSLLAQAEQIKNSVDRYGHVKELEEAKNVCVAAIPVIQALKELDDEQARTDLCSFQHKLRALDQRTATVESDLDIWPGWQLKRKKGVIAKTGAVAWWWTRLMLPRRKKFSQDVMTGSAVIGAGSLAVHAMKNPSVAQPQFYVVQDGTSIPAVAAAANTGSFITAEGAGKAALVLTSIGGAVAAGKFAWAWWNSADSHENLKNAIEDLAQLNRGVRTWVRVEKNGRGIAANGRAIAGLRRVMVTEEKDAERYRTLLDAVRLSWTGLISLAARMRGVEEGVTAVQEGMVTQEIFDEALQTLATAQSVEELAERMLTREEFKAVRPTLATAESVEYVQRALGALRSEQVEALLQAEQARQRLQAAIVAEQEEQRRLFASMAEAQTKALEEHAEKVAATITAEAKRVHVRISGLEDALKQKIVHHAGDFSKALAELVEENREQLGEIKAGLLFTINQNLQQSGKLDELLRRSGGGLGAMHLADMPPVDDSLLACLPSPAVPRAMPMFPCMPGRGERLASGSVPFTALFVAGMFLQPVVDSEGTGSLMELLRMNGSTGGVIVEELLEEGT